jgi:hypothetical protein
MRSMNCHDIRRKIEETELDQFPGDEAAAHLNACESCREFQKERAALRQLVGSLGMVSAPADFDFRLRARLAATNGARSRRRSLFGFLPAPGMPAIALAASFALLVAAAVVFKQVRPSAPHGAQGNAQLASAPVAPSSTSPSSKAVASAQGTPAENMDQARNTLSTVKATDNGPKNSTFEAKTRNRSNRILKPGDERILTAASNALAVGPKNNSQEFSSRPAPVISLVAVQVPAANQPMKVSLEDRRGTTRTVSLQPVTFGSQELIERNGASRVSTSSSRGIW